MKWAKIYFCIPCLQNLDEKKAKGLDDIGISFLKLGMCVITEPLTHIINQSINTGIFPDQWKEARVLPLHKSGLITDDPYNYRPISILSVLSKIIERHVHDHIYKRLSEHYLLNMNTNLDSALNIHVTQPCYK